MPRKTRMYLPGVLSHICQRDNDRKASPLICISTSALGDYAMHEIPAGSLSAAGEGEHGRVLYSVFFEQ
jgi:hypothetical protein